MGRLVFSAGFIFSGLLPASSWGQAKTVEEAISGFKAEIAELKEGVAAGEAFKGCISLPKFGVLFFFLSGSDTFVKTYQDIWSLTQLPTLWGVDSEVLPWFTQQCRPLDWGYMGYMMWTMGFWFTPFRIISPWTDWTPGRQGLFAGSATHKNEFPVWIQVRNHQGIHFRIVGHIIWIYLD